MRPPLDLWRDPMLRIPADDVSQTIQTIEADGYVVLESAVSEDLAGELAESVLRSSQRAPGVGGVEFVVCLPTHDVGFIELAVYSTVLALPKHSLGGRTDPAPNAFAWPAEDQVRIGAIDGLVSHPRNAMGWWHLDSPMGQLNPGRPLPDFPILVNAIWMLRCSVTRPVPPESCPAATDSGVCHQPSSSGWKVRSIAADRPEASPSFPTLSGTEPRVGVACNYLS